MKRQSYSLGCRKRNFGSQARSNIYYDHQAKNSNSSPPCLIIVHPSLAFMLSRVWLWRMRERSIRFSQHDRTVTQIPNTSSSARSCSLPSPTQAFLTLQNFTYTSPVRSLSCPYEVARSPHENNMLGANTISVLARFCENNWEKGKDFVKTFYVKKPMWEREGSTSARWMTCLGFG